MFVVPRGEYDGLEGACAGRSYSTTTLCDLPGTPGVEGKGALAAMRRPPKSNIKLRLIDTGCGHDLVGKRDVAQLRKFVHPAVEPLFLKTANGSTDANEVIDVTVEGFGEEVQPYILESTPPVLSVGVRCAEMGYTFI